MNEETPKVEAKVEIKAPPKPKAKGLDPKSKYSVLDATSFTNTKTKLEWECTSVEEKALVVINDALKSFKGDYNLAHINQDGPKCTHRGLLFFKGAKVGHAETVYDEAADKFIVNFLWKKDHKPTKK